MFNTLPSDYLLSPNKYIQTKTISIFFWSFSSEKSNCSIKHLGVNLIISSECLIFWLIRESKRETFIKYVIYWNSLDEGGILLVFRQFSYYNDVISIVRFESPIIDEMAKLWRDLYKNIATARVEDIQKNPRDAKLCLIESKVTWRDVLAHRIFIDFNLHRSAYIWRYLFKAT